MTFRIGIAFFYHESHSFSPLLTGLNAFESEALLRGDAIVEHYRNTATELGGFLSVLDSNNVSAVPLVASAAVPAGEVTDEAFDALCGMMRAELAAAGELDGVLIALHGAMVTPSHRDPETDFVRLVQDEVGAATPLAVTLDLHANVTQQLVDTGAACFGFQTYPHVDMFEQGVRAASHLLEVLTHQSTWFQAFAKVPALLPSINMLTASGPMHNLTQHAIASEVGDDVVAASVFGGFPYADIPGAGASVVVLARSSETARRTSVELATELWQLRGEFVEELPGVSAGFDLAAQPGRRAPVVIADVADNPLSGGSADTTALLHEAVRRDLHSVLFGAMCDPAALERAREAGVGGTFDCSFAGIRSPEFGEPVALELEVIALSDGRFTNEGPMNAGLSVDVEGAAHLRSKGIDLLVTGRPITANDPNLFQHIGIDIQSYRLLVLKVKNHFRAAFEPLVGDIISVDAPGVATTDFRRLPYRHLPQDLWPLDADRSFTAEAHLVELHRQDSHRGGA